MKLADLCIFNTLFGRYKFNRFPFGLNLIPEICQRKNMEIFGNIPNVSIYFDDLIKSGSNELEHDKTFKTVIERAKNMVLILITAKCNINYQRLTFYVKSFLKMVYNLQLKTSVLY